MRPKLNLGDASGGGANSVNASNALVVNGGMVAVGSVFINGNATVSSLSGTGGIVNTLQGATNGVRGFKVDQATNTTYAGSIQDTGAGLRTLAFTKAGIGTLNLTGNSTYAGTTTVSAGTLLINGNNSGATGAFNVESGATLGGNGTIGGATTINGILAPGNSIGTLNITANTTWTGASTAGTATDWKFELDSGNTSDLLNITGDFLKDTTAGSVFRFDFMGSTATGTFKLVDWTGATGFSSGDFAWNNLGGGNTVTGFNVDNATSALYVTVAIPEPSTWALLAASLTTVVLRRRRRSA